jgi:hypothetical protein
MNETGGGESKREDGTNGNNGTDGKRSEGYV